MRLNITADYVPLEDFKNLLNSTSNLKDVYLLCHQAGCPVYVVRDINDKCAITWHPCIDEERNTLNIVIKEGVFALLYNKEVQPFESLEDLKKDFIAKHMLGKIPFDIDYLVWSKS